MRSSPATSRRRSSRRWPSIVARSPPSRASAPSRISATLWRRWSGRAGCSARVSNVFYVLAGADTNDAIQAIERDMAPRLARHWNEIHLNEALFARIDAAASARRRPRPDARAGAGAGALPRALPPRRRRARCRRQGAAEGDRRPARQPRHGVRPECARGRAGLHAAARRRRSRRPAGFCARRGARRRRGARPHAATR